MKRLTAMSALLAFLPPASFAGGLEFIPNDPVVMAPARAQQDWTGPYAGLSYGRLSQKTVSTECFKLGRPKACDDPIFDYYPEYKEVVTTESKSTADSFGAFVGWRYDLGHLVAGIEAGRTGDLTTVEGQAGISLGRVLVYGLAGGSDQGSFYGAGADVRLGERFLVGVKGIEGDFGQLTTIRFGVEF